MRLDGMLTLLRLFSFVFFGRSFYFR